jgi:TM2 domain-containing membrane protein YozV
MEKQKVEIFLMIEGKYFEGYQLSSINDKLLKVDDSRFLQLLSINIKDPTAALIISILGGHFGIDRFFIGDVGLGIAKLLTCGGFGIWTIVDWFLIMARAREVNMQHMQQIFY